MTDQEYIKMILALPDEFFAGWEWQAGDKALSINDQYKRELLLLTTAPLKKLNSNDNVTLLFPHSVDGVTVEEYISNLRPIPSQEQLQKMCLEKEEPFDPDILYVFTDWVYSTLRSVKFSSLESAWLQYVMWVIYKKEWDGEKWL